MSIHDGHRKRLKERFLKEGLENFDDLYVLELLLFYCVPRQDTNILAHRLKDHFGSVEKVIGAPIEELERVEGIGPGISTFISFLRQLHVYCDKQRMDTKVPLTTAELCGEYLRPYFRYQRNEAVYLMMLDAQCRLIDCKLIAEGSINSVGFSIRKVVEMALAFNAVSVILAHNHPGGVELPSPEDIQTTERIAQSLQLVDVVLADHFVFSDESYLSMVKSNYFQRKRLG